MKRKYNTIIYVVRRNAYIHGQILEDNFIINMTLQKWKKLSKKPNTQYTQISLASKKFLYQKLTWKSHKFGCLTNEELPSIYK